MFYIKEAFEKKFNHAGIPAENDTRWNSTLRQINAVLSKGMVELNTISADEKRNELVFSSKQWAQLKELSELLEPFKVSTDELQADQVYFLYAYCSQQPDVFDRF